MSENRKPLPVLVRGSNDIASAVALRLQRAGYAVILHEVAQPTATRRKMAFTDAVFEGRASFEGLQAVRIDDLASLEDTLAAPDTIPLVVSDFSQLLETCRPAVLVDARMRKHQQPESQRGLAPLTIGLGPNFIAGQNVDLAIETSWGEALGQVVWSGPTLPLRGEPRSLAGHARQRYVYAPSAGVFRTELQIGDAVQQGQVVGWLDATPLPAPLTGRLRGLTHSGVPVQPGAKLIEVDPRAEAAEINGLSQRPRQIAEGVLQAIQGWASVS